MGKFINRNPIKPREVSVEAGTMRLRTRLVDEDYGVLTRLTADVTAAVKNKEAFILYLGTKYGLVNGDLIHDDGSLTRQPKAGGS